MTHAHFMMMSSNGNILRVTDPLCGESPQSGQWRGALMFSLICVWIKDWVNNREADDLRRHRGLYDVPVMCTHQTYCGHTRIYMIRNAYIVNAHSHTLSTHTRIHFACSLAWIKCKVHTQMCMHKIFTASLHICMHQIHSPSHSHACDALPTHM